MKKLFCFVAVFLMLTVVGCRRNKTIQYVRVVQDSTEAAADDIPGVEDIEGYIGDDEGVFEMPDPPQERPVNMRSNSKEMEKVMKGEE